MTTLRAIILPLIALIALAARGEEADTLSCRPAIPQLIAPASLIAVGSVASASHWWRAEVDARVDDAMGSSRRWRIANYAEWLPYAAAIGGEYIGGRPAAPLADRAILSATSFVILEAITQPVKRIVGRRRPDGSDLHSFPSGHTAVAFAGAELTRALYGNLWGAGAYVVASGVAAMRLAGRHHFLSDCIAGAGIGILSARLALWLLPWERRLFHLPSPSRPDGASASSLIIIPSASTDRLACSLILSF